MARLSWLLSMAFGAAVLTGAAALADHPGAGLDAVMAKRERYFEAIDRPVPTFVLQDTQGVLLSPREFEGKVVMLQFIYTHCPDVCPLHAEKIAEIQEPWIEATILTPDEYLGSVLKLCQDRRGSQKELTYVGSRAMVKYDLPLNEVVFDFYDRLKSVSKGYASFDYHLTDYKPADLVKMQILVNAEPVDALSMLVHRTRAEGRGRAMVEKMKELIPPHMFQIPIQAAIGGKVIARETVRALRKDVTAKCYGGDITRKRKLLEKQKEGKKKMRQFGKVDIPQNAFFEALKMGDN